MNLKNQFYKQRHLADSVHDMGCSQKAKKSLLKPPEIVKK